VIGWVPPLIATQIIEEIKRVDPKEQWERPPLPCSGEESGEGCERCDPGISQQSITFRPDQRLMHAWNPAS